MQMFGKQKSPPTAATVSGPRVDINCVQTNSINPFIIHNLIMEGQVWLKYIKEAENGL